MKRINNWFKNTSTHKCATVFVYIGAVIFIIIALVGWFMGKENAVGMMNCAAMVIIANSAQYAGKSAAEHKWGIFSNPIITSTLNGLASGDPTSGITQVANTVQAQAQMEQAMNQGQQTNISNSDQIDPNDNSVSSSMGNENMPQINSNIENQQISDNTNKNKGDN